MVSCLPPHIVPVYRKSNVAPFRAANGTAIPVHGTSILTFEIDGFSKPFSWNFYVANVNQPILGEDFLAFHKLLVDCGNRRLVYLPNPQNSNTRFSTSPSNIPAQPCIRSIQFTPTMPEVNKTRFNKFISRYSGLTLPRSPSNPVTLPVEHHIVTTGPPCYSRYRRLFGDKLKASENEFYRMEREGICQRSTSPWATPLHVVTKPDGSLRPCGDFRALNVMTLPDRYPMPRIDDITQSFRGATVFTLLDLQKAFYQIKMAITDIPKTAITTPFGSFEFLYMPFGLRNASQTFQRCIDMLLEDMPFAKGYIDDIIIASSNIETHFKHLECVLSRLQHYNMRVNFKNANFSYLVPFISAAKLTLMALDLPNQE
jgi:hypothetical protein